MQLRQIHATTINRDDDVFLAVREQARHERRTAGEVLSTFVRRALDQSASTGRTRAEWARRPKCDSSSWLSALAASGARHL